MVNQLYMKKTFKDVKPGDTIYSVYFHQATTRITKLTVDSTEERCGKIKIFLKPSGYIYVSPKCSYERERDYFWRGAWFTTLEEAQKECKTMASNRIKELKEEIKKANFKLRKWEGHKAALDEGVFNIK